MQIITVNSIHELEQHKNESGKIHGAFHMPDDLYRQADGLSSTLIKTAAESLVDYKEAKYPDQRRPKTFEKETAYVVGNALHTYVLEYAEFKNRFVVKDSSVDLRTKEGKSWRSSLNGREVLSEFDYYQVIKMAEACIKNTYFAEMLLSKYHTELAIFWECPITMMQLKGKLDFINDRFIVDLKTQSKQVKEFFIKRSILDCNDALQAVHYSEGARIVFGKDFLFKFLFVEKTDAAKTQLVSFSPDTWAYNNHLYYQLLENIAHAEATGEFPTGLPKEIIL